MCESTRECAVLKKRLVAAEAEVGRLQSSMLSLSSELREAREVAQAIVNRLAALAGQREIVVCVDAATGATGKFPGRFVPSEALREIIRDATDIGAPPPASALSVAAGIEREREACACLIESSRGGKTLVDLARDIRNRRTS